MPIITNAPYLVGPNNFVYSTSLTVAADYGNRFLNQLVRILQSVVLQRILQIFLIKTEIEIFQVACGKESCLNHDSVESLQLPAIGLQYAD